MTARLIEGFEAGTNGATIVAAGNITNVTGTPTYSSTTPLHGFLSMDVATTTASMFVRFPVAPGTVTHSGSMLVRVTDWSAGSMNILRFADTANSPLASISLTATNKIAILDSTSTAAATSTTGVWALNTPFRIAWEYDAATPTAPIITVRVFAGVTGTVQTDQITATPAETLVLDRWMFGHVGTSGSNYGVKLDSFQISNTVEWLPPATFGGVVSIDGHTLTYHMNRKAGTLVGGVPTKTAQGAAQIWAGTPGADLVGALNVKAGNVLPNYRELAGVLNQLAGTTGLEVDGAAASIP